MASRKSLRAVNLLFLLTLCLELANIFLMWMPQYVRLVLNEALFVFLPAYLYLRLTHQPLRERVRWHWPGWKIALLALLIGAGLYPLSAISAGVLFNLLGYVTATTPADAFPTTALMGVLAILAYGVMAPLCEEFLCRGVIQPVYETRGPKWAVLFVGFLFIAFHLSLLQGLSILLLALALGYVNYRTRSLPASILTHMGANGLAAMVVTEGVFHTGISRWIVSLPALLAGLLIAILATVALTLLTRRPSAVAQDEPQIVPQAEPALPAAAPARQRPLWLAAGWPLLIAALIYFPTIGSEFIYSRNPELASSALKVGRPAWQGSPQWHYEIRNVLDEVVGEGDCRLELREPAAELTCTSAVIAYEAQKGSSYFSSSGGERVDTLRWRLEDGQLLNGASLMTLSDGSFTSEQRWSLGSADILVRVSENGGEWSSTSIPFDRTPLAKDSRLPVVSDYTWPWQLAGVELKPGTQGRVVRLQPYTWRSASNDNGAVAEAQLAAVHACQQVSTPAGSFHACEVTLGNDKSAWLDAQTLAPVKFFNGIETWVLK